MSASRFSQAKKVTLIGALVNILQGFLKLIVGFMAHSHALVADGVHSFSDLATDVMVLFASKYGSLDADEAHPYGHQRIETAATFFLSLLLILAGLGIAWDALSALRQPHPIPAWFSLPVILGSVAANELLFQYTLAVGNRIRSQLIVTNAWHHRSDAASSLVVLAGLLGSFAGYSFLDALAALIVGALIVKMGWDYSYNSVKELIDTGVTSDLRMHIERVIHATPGVKKIHQLRTRYMGHHILIDVHILVCAEISVSEGHYIAQKVHDALTKQVDFVSDVTVHVDTEDDELTNPQAHLPSRKELETEALRDILEQFPEILFWNIHYLNGSIHLDVICPQNYPRYDKLRQSLLVLLNSQSEIVLVRLLNLQEIMEN